LPDLAPLTSSVQERCVARLLAAVRDSSASSWDGHDPFFGETVAKDTWNGSMGLQSAFPLHSPDGLLQDGAFSTSG
jgi:hypothetical protein